MVDTRHANTQELKEELPVSLQDTNSVQQWEETKRLPFVRHAWSNSKIIILAALTTVVFLLVKCASQLTDRYSASFRNLAEGPGGRAYKGSGFKQARRETL